jgi:hypothetical protein
MDNLTTSYFTIDRLGQDHLHPVLEHPRLTPTGQGEQNNKKLFGQTQTVWLDERDKPIQFRSSISTSVADPNPDPDLSDPYDFGPPGSGSGSFYHQAKIVRKTLISTVL